MFNIDTRVVVFRSKFSHLCTNLPGFFVSWPTLVDLFNWFCLSAFVPAYLSVRFGVWLYQPIWFIISHQCCGPDRILTPRGPMCFFPLDIALVPVSSHGTSDILPCETVRVTCFQLMLILAEYSWYSSLDTMLFILLAVLTSWLFLYTWK